MFNHDKNLLRPVKIERTNAQYAALLQEQLGGPNGELKAALQYISQSFRIKDPTLKDLFLDIGAEELGHMEMIAQTINLLNGHDLAVEQVKSGEIETHVLGGLSPMLVNASGAPWTANYVNVTGDIAADLLSNIAAEQRAKVVYEYLYRQIDDKYVIFPQITEVSKIINKELFENIRKVDTSKPFNSKNGPFLSKKEIFDYLTKLKIT